MSKDQIREYASDILLSTGAGSWGAYTMFKSISEFCRDLLPITGVISFIIYLFLNWSKIKQSVPFIFKTKYNASKSTKKNRN